MLADAAERGRDGARGRGGSRIAAREGVMNGAGYNPDIQDLDDGGISTPGAFEDDYCALCGYDPCVCGPCNECGSPDHNADICPCGRDPYDRDFTEPYEP